MKPKAIAILIGSIVILTAVALLISQRDRIRFLFDPAGARVVLVQYVNESGHQTSRFAGSFDTFEECEKAREHLPKGGGFVLGGVCVREAQWKELNH